MRFLEQKIQINIFKWASMNLGKYPELKLLNASQNGAKRSVMNGAISKKAGLKAGFPDLFLPIARNGYHGLFIELKTIENKKLNIKKGKLSQQQKIWINSLNQEGYRAVVCYGFDSAVAEIEKYLKS